MTAPGWKRGSLIALGMIAAGSTSACEGSDGGSAVSGHTPEQTGVRCDPCSIELDEFVVITDRGAPGGASLTHPTVVTTDHRGRFFAAEAGESTGRLIVFDDSGLPIEVAGSRGEGPGEFISAHPPIATPERELMVFDSHARKTVFLAEDLSFAREVRIPYAPRLPLAGRRFLVHQPIQGPDRFGYAFHVVDESGEIERSFGGSGEFAVDEPWLFTHTMALTEDGLLWATPTEAHLDLRLLDPADGSELRSLPTSWPRFRPMEPGLGRDIRRFQPTSSVQGLILEPALGVLWVLIQSPAEAWQPSRDPSVPAPGPEPLTYEDRIAAYRWVVLAIEDTTGRIIAEREFDAPLFVSPGNDFMTSWGEVRGDDVRIPLVRPRLVQRTGS